MTGAELLDKLRALPPEALVYPVWYAGHGIECELDSVSLLLDPGDESIVLEP